MIAQPAKSWNSTHSHCCLHDQHEIPCFLSPRLPQRNNHYVLGRLMPHRTINPISLHVRSNPGLLGALVFDTSQCHSVRHDHDDDDDRLHSASSSSKGPSQRIRVIQMRQDLPSIFDSGPTSCLPRTTPTPTTTNNNRTYYRTTSASAHSDPSPRTTQAPPHWASLPMGP